jgi:hypothetical protein
MLLPGRFHTTKTLKRHCSQPQLQGIMEANVDPLARGPDWGTPLPTFRLLTLAEL